MDFLVITTRSVKRGTIEIYPKFILKKSKDLMIRGGDFYAIWMDDIGLWSTDEDDVIRMIDRELDKFAEENKMRFGDSNVKVLHMWDAESGMIDTWHKYCQKQMRDCFHALDENLIFSNTVTKKEDYASKRLPYPLESGPCPAWDTIMSTLYFEEERHKLEWAIGAIVSGDSKNIQKFLVLYGSAGTGKSTVLNIIQQLFEGYYSVFDAKALGSSSNSFALEAFKTNPLVAIQHDGDLSKIEDNTRLNSLVSHELMTVNEKFKSAYANRFNCFLLMGTNKPVKITDAKSGLIRRLIDVTPSGNKLANKDYNKAMKQINFELGAIASHCLDVYTNNKGAYDDYVPVAMMGASNDFYNFVLESYYVFKKDDSTTLKASWEMYKNYCEEAKVSYPFSKRIFKEELKNYFYDYKERSSGDDGSRIRNIYLGFRTDKFDDSDSKQKPVETKGYTINFVEGIESIFDLVCANELAQYASANDIPATKWTNVKSTLSALDTSRTHYVKVPENHIVIDFDIPDEEGNKCYEKNLQAASLWPPTYAELSKSGSGVHLHYIYTGDVSKLSRIYDDHIEIKVYTGNGSLRRRLSKCNDLPIATISSGLPLKGEKTLINFDGVVTEKGIRTSIKKGLNKEVHPHTKSNIDFIHMILENAYDEGVCYDVSDMRNAVLAFAANSTNQAEYCIKLVNKMKFKSEEPSESVPYNAARDIAFFDIEVFPNLLLVNYKIKGPNKPMIRLINPTPEMIEDMLQYRLIGFNCRRYDNHILYARLMGYDNMAIYKLSQKIISGEKNAMFGEAYNISYTDVYDFASAANKMSLKKFEIKLGLHHQELGLPWDQPVPEELWPKVAEYCDNDVFATEAVFDYLSADFTARQILADLAGMTVNDTTNTLTTRIIFGNNKKPHNEFMYRDLAEPVQDLPTDVYNFLADACPEMMSKPHYGWQLENADEVPFGSESMLPYFPGYKYEFGKSTYRGEEVGEGGWVYSLPGIYGNVALLDVSSMHPHSAIAECLFGIRYTKAFQDIVEGRVSIKHEAWEIVNGMLDGKLTPYIQKVIDGEMTSGDLANALKTAINSVYGLTSAKFDNPFKDPRNIDNIVAKRGALFMVDLKNAVEERGFIVAHIKTDSIKIPDATPEIIDFVMEFGKRYGYSFEHEATYDRMALVNKAVYIAKYSTPEQCQELYGYVPGDINNPKKAGKWTATGDQFAVPYVFKNLFSKEPIVFEDLCETFSVSKGDLYLDMNETLPDVSDLEKEVTKAENQYKKGKLSDTDFDRIRADLLPEIEKGHDYHFVGRVGQFTPIKPGYGGGVLYRINDGKNYAASGSTGFRWLESEIVKNVGKEDTVDKRYYDKLVTEAIETISTYGNFDWLVSDDPYIKPEYARDVKSGMLSPVYSDEEMPFN